ncbi:MAG: hypothetical protein R2838_08360 [Caldilineaceae bacterium]
MAVVRRRTAARARRRHNRRHGWTGRGRFCPGLPGPGGFGPAGRHQSPSPANRSRVARRAAGRCSSASTTTLPRPQFGIGQADIMYST